MQRDTLSTLIFFLLTTLVSCKAFNNTSSVSIEKGPKMPTSVFDMGYATDGKIIFSLGGTKSIGNNRQLPTDEIYLFSPFGGGWRKGKFTEKPLVKSPNRSVYLPEFGIIMSTGFFNVTRGGLHTFPCEILDLKNYNIGYLTNNPHWAEGSSIVEWNLKTYVFGGIAYEENGEKHYSNRMLSYDPATNNWTDLKPMPTSRVTQGVVVGNSLYTFGGFDEEHAFADIYRYDFEKDFWELIGYLPYPVSRFAIVQKYPYVFLCNVGEDKNIIGRIDIRDASYKEFPTWITVTYPGAAVLGDRLYIFGGSWDRGHTGSNKTFQIPLSELMAEN